MKTETVRVKMLGNIDILEVGKEYELDMDRANQLSGIGYAVIIARKPAVEKGVDNAV